MTAKSKGNFVDRLDSEYGSGLLLLCASRPIAARGPQFAICRRGCGRRQFTMDRIFLSYSFPGNGHLVARGNVAYRWVATFSARTPGVYSCSFAYIWVESSCPRSDDSFVLCEKSSGLRASVPAFLWDGRAVDFPPLTEIILNPRAQAHLKTRCPRHAIFLSTSALFRRSHWKWFSGNNVAQELQPQWTGPERHVGSGVHEPRPKSEFVLVGTVVLIAGISYGVWENFFQRMASQSKHVPCAVKYIKHRRCLGPWR